MASVSKNRTYLNGESGNVIKFIKSYRTKDSTPLSEAWNDGKMEYWDHKYELQTQNGERAMKKRGWSKSGLVFVLSLSLLLFVSFIGFVTRER
jgi:hypothetical protein